MEKERQTERDSNRDREREREREKIMSSGKKKNKNREKGWETYWIGFFSLSLLNRCPFPPHVLPLHSCSVLSIHHYIFSGGKQLSFSLRLSCASPQEPNEHKNAFSSQQFGTATSSKSAPLRIPDTPMQRHDALHLWLNEPHTTGQDATM